MTTKAKYLQPWQKPFYHSCGVVRLHEEIIDFCNYIKPTVLEEKVRQSVVDRVKNVILNRWPSATVHVFGSFATGLYLPTSDIDIVVFGEWHSSPLLTVENIIRDSNIASDIKVIDKATVPIVKLVDKETSMAVDISFNKDNGVKSVTVIREYVSKYPHVRPLFLVLKQFMLQRDLNEVWTGGIGSYSLMLLCVSFMQQYNRNYSGPMNLGCLLLEFLELYGRSFNFLSTRISVEGRGCYKRRCQQDNGGGGGQWRKAAFVSIEDPLDCDHDVARGCKGLLGIRASLGAAYCRLQRRVLPQWSCEESGSSSVLATAVCVAPDVHRARLELKERFQAPMECAEEEARCVSPCTSVPTVTRGRAGLRRRRQRGVGGASERRLRGVLRVTRGRVGKAHNWAELAEWSQDNVFN